MAILLIRHGETDLNASRVVQFPDTPLGQNGLSQADQLGRALSQRSIGNILSSDYARARMTAEKIHQHCGVPLIENEHLRERNFGDLRGQAYDDLGEVDILANDFNPPGGETWNEFHARVDSAWEFILTQAERISDDIAVVTHGLVLRSLLGRILDTGDHVVDAELVVANTSVTEVSPLSPWSVHRLAAVDHLEEPVRSGGAV